MKYPSKRTADARPCPPPRRRPWLAALVAVVLLPFPLAAAGPAPGHPSWQMDTGG